MSIGIALGEPRKAWIQKVDHWWGAIEVSGIEEKTQRLLLSKFNWDPCS